MIKYINKRNTQFTNTKVNSIIIYLEITQQKNKRSNFYDLKMFVLKHWFVNNSTLRSTIQLNEFNYRQKEK